MSLRRWGSYILAVKLYRQNLHWKLQSCLRGFIYIPPNDNVASVESFERYVQQIIDIVKTTPRQQSSWHVISMQETMIGTFATSMPTTVRSRYARISLTLSKKTDSVNLKKHLLRLKDVLQRALLQRTNIIGLMLIQQHWITMFYHIYFTTRKWLQNGISPSVWRLHYDN